MRRLLRTIRNPKAAIDLASIMVGVIIVGLLSGVIGTTVFAVIPWTQDEAAKSAASTVQAAEAGHLALTQRYGTATELQSAGLLNRSVNVGVQTNPTGTCFTTVSRSLTTKFVWADDRTNPPQPYTPGTTMSGCVNVESMVAAVMAAAGPAGETTVTNLATNSGGEDSTATTTVRTNYALNPTPAANVTGWTTSGSTTATLTFQGSGGPSATAGRWAKDAITGPSTPDHVVIFGGTGTTPQAGHLNAVSGWVYSSKTVDLRFQAWTYGPGYLGVGEDLNSDPFTVTAGTWTYINLPMKPFGTGDYTSFIVMLRLTNTATVTSGDILGLAGMAATDAYRSGSNASFAGDTAAAGDFTYAWSGTANASSSFELGKKPTGTGAGTPTTVRVYAKPYISSDWSSSGSKSIAIRSIGHTDEFVNVSGMMPITAGKTYTVAVKIHTTRPISDPQQLFLRIYAPGALADTKFYSGQTGPAGDFTIRATFSTAGMTSLAYVRPMNSDTTPDAVTYFDDITLVEVPDLAHPYTGPAFSGDTPGAHWTGTPNQSASVLY